MTGGEYTEEQLMLPALVPRLRAGHVLAANVYSRDKAEVVGDDLGARTKVFRELARRVLVLMVEIGREKGRMPHGGTSSVTCRPFSAS